MLSKSKFRKKARRITISEIMIPVILLFVLGVTTIVFCLKILHFDMPFLDAIIDEESVEVKWIINLGVVMTYSAFDLLSAYFVYTGIKQRSYWKCRLWVIIQIVVMCLFTVAVMKRSSAVIGGFHFFEFIALCAAIYIYKIHHVTFVAGLLEELKGSRIPKMEKSSEACSSDRMSMVTPL